MNGNDRTLAIELDGILRPIPATYHQAGALAGRVITGARFRAWSPVRGECPVPVPMALHRPTARTDHRLIVLDNTGIRWVMAFTAQHGANLYKITGFYPGL